MVRFLLLLFVAGSLHGCAAPASKESIATRHVIVQTAMDQLGVPYRYGATGPDGFDCSGLVDFVYGKAGYQLPHNTTDLLKSGKRISYDDARVGDLLFYRFSDRKKPSMHVAIYMGDDWMIHAPSSGGTVSKVRNDGKPWPKRYVGAVRIIQ